MTKILIDRATVEQALEALYEETAWFGPTPKGAAAITALRAALAEPDGPCPTCVALARTVMMDQMGRA